MAVKITFDGSHNVIPPTIVLTNRSGKKIGAIPYYNATYKDSMPTRDSSELSFKVNKRDCELNFASAKTIHVAALKTTSSQISDSLTYTNVYTLTADEYNNLKKYVNNNKVLNEKATVTYKPSGADNSRNTIYNSLYFSMDNSGNIYIKQSSNNVDVLRVSCQRELSVYNAGAMPVNSLCSVTLEFDVKATKINDNFWNMIDDFKLVWVKDWDRFFEINVSVDETEHTVKNITAKSLGEAELSQINLHNIEINTKDDIARDDYKPTVLYNANDKSASLLHRILEKAPHYNIVLVDSSLRNIQRTFQFDSVSILDAFQTIAKEMECIFEIICHSENGQISRDIYVRDLNTYGEDTNILITTDVLAENINYSLNASSVKNCFKLVAGDDLMTATVRNCNPNGSDYIWYFSDNMISDMSSELSTKLSSYTDFVNYYQNVYNPLAVNTSTLSQPDSAKAKSVLNGYKNNIISNYNKLIDKYSSHTSNYSKVQSPMVGYPAIMETYYNVIDFYQYLNSSLMPTVETSSTNAKLEAAKLNYSNLNGVAIPGLSSSTGTATVSSAVISMAKSLVDPIYQVVVADDNAEFTYSESKKRWKGKLTVTNYGDSEDTYTTDFISVNIGTDYYAFITQKINMTLANSRSNTVSSITELFALSDNEFKAELRKYSLQRLIAFQDACQNCIDIILEKGGASEDSQMHSTLYLPYYNKLSYIQSEIDLRESEIEIVKGKFDSNGGILKQGMQTILDKERQQIQNNLNFQNYLGTDLWLEFAAYRREDVYKNDNFVSDGLGNDELFDRANEFIELATKEIIESATLQHTISSNLRNFLVIKEFAPIIDTFAVGNYLRLKVDGKLYKMRLAEYVIDFDDLSNIDITFSDIVLAKNGINSIKDILNQAVSMSTSYNSVTKQASRGDASASMLDNWVDNGLSVTNTKIIDSANNQQVTWDTHGFQCREYDDLSGSYSDKQLKLINKGLYLTDNNWRTAKAGIGDFIYFNPGANDGEGAYQEAYGVIADTLVGNLILGKNVGIYNTKNSIVMDENGFIMTTNNVSVNDPQPVFTIRRKTTSGGNTTYNDMFYIDSNGYVTINGGIKIDAGGGNNSSTMLEMVDGKITTHITDELNDGGLIETSINQTASEIKSTASRAVKQWDIGNYTIDLYGYDTPQASGYLPGKSWKVTGHTINLTGYGHPYTDMGYQPGAYDGKYYFDRENGLLYYSVGAVWSPVREDVYTATLISDNRGKRFLNQTNGYVYYSDNAQWTKSAELSLITDTLDTKIEETADAILLSASSTYETKTDANNKKSALESSIRITASNIESTVKATSGWDIASLSYTVDLIGTASGTAVSGQSYYTISGYTASDYKGKYYLDDLNGKVYESKVVNGVYNWYLKTTLTRNNSSLQSQITQTANSILASAENLNNNYYKKTELQITDNGVTSSVTSYLTGNYTKTSGLGTVIQQSASAVRIAWNNNTKYISFEDAALNIYTSNLPDNASSTQKNNNRLLRLNTAGMTVYNASSGVSVMRIDKFGTNFWATDSNHTYLGYIGQGHQTLTITTDNGSTSETMYGLDFNLEATNGYMAWNVLPSGGSNYVHKFVYYPTTHANFTPTYSEYDIRQGFHFKDYVYFESNVSFRNDDVYFNGNVHVADGENLYVNDICTKSEGLTFWTYRSDDGKYHNGLKVSDEYIESWRDFNMHNYDILNANISSSSDVRLKENIADSTVNALDIINAIELKEFNWKKDGSHTSVGIIAQQLKEVVPELVSVSQPDNMLSINICKFIPFIVKAIQEVDQKYKEKERKT